MSTTAPAQKATPRKAAPAADKKRAAAGSAKTGQGLRIRYYGVMRPQKVYSLVVEVDDPLQADGGRGGIVVVRPVIPGAQVVPAEQRLDVSTRGNQITFHVTPLARGKLPEARLDVFSPGQPAQEVKLPLKVKTMRGAMVLLALAVLLPLLLRAITIGEWRMKGWVPLNEAKTEVLPDNLPMLPSEWQQQHAHKDVKERPAPPQVKDAVEGQPPDVLRYQVRKNLGPRVLGSIPVVNEPVGFLGDFNLRDGLGDGLKWLYHWTTLAVQEFRLSLILFVLFAALALLALLFSRSRRTYRRYRLSAPVGAEPVGEPAALQPI